MRRRGEPPDGRSLDGKGSNRAKWRCQQSGWENARKEVELEVVKDVGKHEVGNKPTG